MQHIALIEDDPPTSEQLAGWIRAAKPGLQIDQWFNRDDAEAALARQRYDVVVLDIELGRERHAGVAIINTINKLYPGTPVLVISAMPAALYRSIMKALDAWDYLQKTTFDEQEFVETFLDILRASRAAAMAATGHGMPTNAQTSFAPPASAQSSLTSASHATSAAAASGAGFGQSPAGAGDLVLDPLWQRTATWQGQRINLPLTAQRILAALYQQMGDVVSYETLFDVVKSGRNRDNVRKHVATIREAFRELDPAFNSLESVPMRGFRWVPPAKTSAKTHTANPFSAGKFKA